MFPNRYALVINTEPLIEPLTANEAKEHCRIDAGTISDTITETPTINVASYSTGLSTGSGVDVMGYTVVVNAVAGTVNAGATVDIHLEESDDNVTYADVIGSTFTQLSTANQNSVVEKEYSGSKQYVRASATVAGDAVYGVNVLKHASYSPEDTYIESLITAARQMVETHTGRRLINSKWDYYLDEFPCKDYIKLPYAPLVSVTSIKYTDCNSVENTMSTDEYSVDTNSVPGRIVLEYGESWPSDTLHPANPIKITYTAGYGETSTGIPKAIRQAMLLVIGDLYENRENSHDTKFGELKKIPTGAKLLLSHYRVRM